MSTLLDDRVGIKKESVYNTPVVVDRCLLYTSPSPRDA